MKKIAVINDLSGFGKCSLTAAIPIISVLKAQCCPITTAVLSNQTGYDDYFCKDLTDELPAVIDKIKKLNPTFDGILTGFISNPKQGKIIADFIDYFKKDGTLVVVDPVMADDGAVYDCYTDECVNAIKEITKKADIITPNLTELCILCDDDFNVVNSLSDNNKLTAVRIMCESLCRKSGRDLKISVSGIRLSNNMIANAVYDNDKFDVIRTKAQGGSFSGTGDILSSIITAKCTAGETLLNAVACAGDFIGKAIAETISDTNGCYNTADGVHFEKFLAELGGYTENEK